MTHLEAFWFAFAIAAGAFGGIGWALLTALVIAAAITWVGSKVTRR